MVSHCDPKAQPLESVVAPAQEENVPTLQDFLLERKQDPTNSVVIGNEAGDADTIVTSLVLAYVESVQAGANKTPVVAIDRLDLDTQRPEVSFLFKLAGISSDDVLCVDDPYVESLQVAAVTLTDHNRLAPALQYRRNWTVIEIVDHHQDEGEYTATCSGESRTIAFAEGKALVASACTLVAERLFELWKPPSGLFPGSVGVLLLGVILLDSVGLSEEVGKVTQRDRDAVQRLISRTDWDELPDASKQTLRLASASSAPDPMALFDLLQDSKYDTGFWNSLNVRDSLRQDYKSFPCTNGFEFGISSVLMPAQLFLSKEHVVDGVLDYMADSNVTFLAIMFAFQDEQRRLHRQLAFCSTDNDPSRLDALVTHLESSPPPQGEDNSLDLRELGPLEDAAMISQPRHSPVLWFRVFEQRNAVPSRKQVGPILEELFESPS
jgi:exopolyphosphatase